ncbi:hypothetical protein JCM8202_005303 [Rhodotorula sphaerocarpa]
MSARRQQLQPERQSADPSTSSFFLPADPEASSELPVPPPQYYEPSASLDTASAGDPGPSSLAHRRANPLPTRTGRPGGDDLVLQSATQARRRKEAAAAIQREAKTSRPGRREQSDEPPESSTRPRKGKGPQRGGRAVSRSSRASQSGASAEEGEDERPRKKRRPGRKPRASESNAVSPAAASESEEDDVSTNMSDGQETEASEFEVAAGPSSSEDDEDANEPGIRRRRRRPHGSRPDSRRGRRRKDAHLEVPSGEGGGPAYEGFARSVPALKSLSVLPPVPPVLEGSQNLLALLMASFDQEEEEAGRRTGGQLASRSDRPELSPEQLAELERAADSGFAETLLQTVQDRLASLDAAYAALSEELSKAQIEASVLGNVKSLLQIRREDIRKKESEAGE